MVLDNQKQSVLKATQRALEQPNSKCKLVANALPSSNGEYWTAILISTPGEMYACGSKCEAPLDIHETGSEQNLWENHLSEAEEKRHSGLVYHSTDTDALLGFCRHLLLDAIFCLWSYSESFPCDDKSIP